MIESRDHEGKGRERRSAGIINPMAYPMIELSLYICQAHLSRSNILQHRYPTHRNQLKYKETCNEKEKNSVGDIRGYVSTLWLALSIFGIGILVLLPALSLQPSL